MTRNSILSYLIKCHVVSLNKVNMKCSLKTTHIFNNNNNAIPILIKTKCIDRISFSHYNIVLLINNNSNLVK